MLLKHFSLSFFIPSVHISPNYSTCSVFLRPFSVFISFSTNYIFPLDNAVSSIIYMCFNYSAYPINSVPFCTNAFSSFSIFVSILCLFFKLHYFPSVHCLFLSFLWISLSSISISFESLHYCRPIFLHTVPSFLPLFWHFPLFHLIVLSWLQITSRSTFPRHSRRFPFLDLRFFFLRSAVVPF